MKFCLLLAIAAALSSASANDVTASTDTVTVEFLGASGGLKIFPAEDTKGFIMVQQAKLEEVGADGSRVGGGASINMAGQNTWTDLSTVVTDGKTVYSTTFAKVSGDTRFELTAHLARETTTVTENVPCNNCTVDTSGGCQRASDMACIADVGATCATNYTHCTESVTVTKDVLKFSIVVEGFPFKSPGNKLQYALFIKDKTGDAGKMKEGGDAALKKISLEGGFIETPTTAVIKGGLEDVVVDVLVTTSEQGSKRVITFLFDSFAEGKALYYDPNLGIEQNGAVSSTAASLPSLALALLAASSVLGAN